MAGAIDMTKGKPSALILRLAVPVLAGNLFQQFYTLVDRVIVGQFVGADAFSAVGATNALSMMFMSMCMGMTMGTSIVVSQYFGSGDEKRIGAAIANGAYVNIIAALVMTGIGLAVTKPMLEILNTPDDLMGDAVSYMRIIMGGLVVVTAYHTPFSILRALGDSKTPLIFLGFCSVLNIILDLVFVVPMDMGVNGAAIATVLAQAVAAVFCLIYSFKKMPEFALAVKNAKPDRGFIGKILKTGIPAGFQYSLMYISTIALQRVVNGFGGSVIGGFTASSQMELLVQQIYAALGVSMLTYTGQNIGAKETERIRQGMSAAMRICAAVSIILLALFWGFGNLIMRIFVSDIEITKIAATGIRITSLFFMALGCMQVLRYLLNGAGDSIYALINGIIEIVARIGFSFMLTSIPTIGMWGIWLTTGLTWSATALFALWRYKKGSWKEKALV